MRINDNIPALGAYTNLLRSGRALERSIARLSSGYRINSVADDAAGHAISDKLRNQINGMTMAARNALDGISLVGTAEGALNEVHAMLHRIRELAVQAANDTNEPSDRVKMQDEIIELFREINDIALKTEFNTIKILAGEGMRTNSDGFHAAPPGVSATDAAINFHDSTAPNHQGVVETRPPGAVPAPGNVVTYRFDRMTGQYIQDDNGRHFRVTHPDDDFDFRGLRLHVGANQGMRMTIDIPDIRNIMNDVAIRYFPGEYTQPNLSAVEDLLNLTESPLPPPAAELEAARAAAGLISLDLEDGDNVDLLRDVVNGVEGSFNDLVFAEAEAALEEGRPVMVHEVADTAVPPLFEVGDPVLFRINPITDMFEVAVPQSYGTHFVLTAGPEDMGIHHEVFRVNVLDVRSASLTIQFADAAMQEISRVRSRLGAFENRLRHTETSLNATNEHTKGSLSRIKDTDMAHEMTINAQFSVIQQAGIAILGQANQRPQQILMLLR